MAEVESLLLQAKRLTAAARLRRDDAAGIQADGQFATALHKLTAQFPELRTQLANRTALVAAGIPVAPAPDLAKSVERLRAHIADIGRPTPQFMTSRSADLTGNIAAIQRSTDEAWRTWAKAQIATLAVDPALLVGPRGDDVAAKIAQLTQSATKPFSTSSLEVFKVWLDQARDQVARLRAPISADEVVARIEGGHGRLSFADLNDEELDALRDAPEHARRVWLSAR